MAKWYGKIGYAIDNEYEPGCWEPTIIERTYKGEIISDRRNRQNSNGVNDNINITNVISIVADPFVIKNSHNIVYAEVMGTLWDVNSVEPQYPRLILTIGGVYNGVKNRTTGDA